MRAIVLATPAPIGTMAPTASATVTSVLLARPSATPEPPAPSPTPTWTATPPSTATPSPAATATPLPLPAATTLADLRVELVPVVANLAAPLFVTHAGDGSGRIFILEKSGVIRILAMAGLLDTPFLDIRDRVGSEASEQGLLGLAFTPDYARSGVFYVNYTDKQGDTVVARFAVTGDSNVADPASESRVLSIDQPAANHNGGMVAFGPDGYLWIGTGDGGAANDMFGNGQNAQTLLGKLLRLDVTSDLAAPYRVPADNPWAQVDWRGQDVRDEVWAVGLRNPWRYSFDRGTGDLWIADVGQNLYEEVDRVAAGSPGGLNFGWPIMEGTRCFPESADCERVGLQMPVTEYPHRDGNCSITGGYVYRGATLPALHGAYLYGDYCSGRIWGLARVGDGWRNVELLDTELNISSFGEDEAGELYVTDLREGGVYRLSLP